MTLDYDSMFTNIPFNHTKMVIKKSFYLIEEETCVSLELFLDAVSFIVVDCSYFLYDGTIYRQSKGLPMGSCLSSVMADISTNYAMTSTLNCINPDDVSFLFKFVDDFIGAMNPEIFDEFCRTLESQIPKLCVKRTHEANDGGVSFLDCWIIREENSFISMRWWQKDCSNKQILNFHSHHPVNMKWNVVNEYIRHALFITSERYRYITLRNLKITMKRSSYPPNFYERMLNYYCRTVENAPKMKKTTTRYPERVAAVPVIADRTIRGDNAVIAGRTTRADGVIIVTSSVGITDENVSIIDEIKIREKGHLTDVYVSVPFINDRVMSKFGSILRRRHIPCKVAPKIMSANRSKVFSNLKDRKDLSDIKHSVFEIRCNQCNFKQTARTNNLDLARTVNFVIRNENSQCCRHEKDQEHEMNLKPHGVKAFQSKYELNLAYRLCTASN